MIKALDSADVHSLCSGQVVSSIGSLVKELLENSIDAKGNSNQQFTFQWHFQSFK